MIIFQHFAEEFKLNVTRAQEVIIMPEAFSVAESEILFNGVRDIRIQEDAFRNSISTKVHCDARLMEPDSNILLI